jgi:hypothetical protein
MMTAREGVIFRQSFSVVMPFLQIIAINLNRSMSDRFNSLGLGSLI